MAEEVGAHLTSTIEAVAPSTSSIPGNLAHASSPHALGNAKTRREILEKRRLRKRVVEEKKQDDSGLRRENSEASLPQTPPCAAASKDSASKSPDDNRTATTVTASSLSPRDLQGGYTALSDIVPCHYLTPPCTSPEHDDGSLPISMGPQHEKCNEGARYFRVVYRGVVALLQRPQLTAPRSGTYLSYGEVFVGHDTVDHWIGTTLTPRTATDTDSANHLSLSSVSSVAPLFPALLSQKQGSKSVRALRVDAVLTGGYAMDTINLGQSIPYDAETPKRTNTHYLPLNDNRALGYVLTEQDSVPVVEPLSARPNMEIGHFLYKIVSTSPVPILTGPSLDAPRTRAMLLPGSVHEVSLRISIDSDIVFLRLSHRRGWIVDRKARRANGPTIPVVQELSTDAQTCDDDGVESFVSSIAVSSVTAQSPASRRRHRPPRRRRDDDDQSLPLQVGGRPTPVSTPVKASKQTEIPADRSMTPGSNLSFLSDDESVDQIVRQPSSVGPVSPDASFAFGTNQSAASLVSQTARYYLMRVTAPRGLKILDAPQFQVNNLIHGKNYVASSHMVSEDERSKIHPSIFQTMAGRTTGPSKTGNPAVFDATTKTRILPHGVLFESSRPMESSGAYSQGAGLIKLSDNSGWAIVPRQDDLERQYRTFHGVDPLARDRQALQAYEQVGNAILETGRLSSVWLRVTSRAGIIVSCPPPSVPMAEPDKDSPSSQGSSAVGESYQVSHYGALTSHDSDVASSVGSAFLDAMFRTPKKNAPKKELARPSIDLQGVSNVIPCGMVVQVERWLDVEGDGLCRQEYARLRGGQGWIPMSHAGKLVAVEVVPAECRFGSFWFRVQASSGIKVRLGPCRKAPSIKSEDGKHFRFECGEFLRASEIITVFSEGREPIESFAKLYRNRHTRLNEPKEDFRKLPSLTAQAEWVQIYDDSEMFLEECAAEPRIERHKQGWRYNVVPDSGVAVRLGPSFGAETTGTILFGGESVLINERVSPAGENMVWLRLKDGQGWVQDTSEGGEQTMIPHSLRHRSHVLGRPRKPPAPKEEIAYNTIIARLFHGDGEHQSRSAGLGR